MWESQPEHDMVLGGCGTAPVQLIYMTKQINSVVSQYSFHILDCPDKVITCLNLLKMQGLLLGQDTLMYCMISCAFHNLDAAV